MNSVLGHLALSFAPSPENLATEALAYILDRSDAARRALEQLGAQLADAERVPLVFRTQAGQSDGAIPDLVGEDANGGQRMVIEAKFWAGLTERQPVDYLARIPPAGGIVLVIAPAQRFETLWPELQRRVTGAGLDSTPKANDGSVYRLVQLAQGRVLGLVSWAMLLRRLGLAASDAGESGVQSDLHQLEGLCAEQDTHAFRPLTAAELSGDTGMRVVQLCHIVNDIVAAAKAEGLFPMLGTRGQGGDGYWGHYVRLGGAVGLYVHFSPQKWTYARATPLWIRVLAIEDGQLRPGQRFLEALRSLAVLEPPGAFMHDNHLEVPLNVPTGQERDYVVRDLLEQVRSVVALLPHAEVGSEKNGSMNEVEVPAMFDDHGSGIESSLPDA